MARASRADTELSMRVRGELTRQLLSARSWQWCPEFRSVSSLVELQQHATFRAPPKYWTARDTLAPNDSRSPVMFVKTSQSARKCTTRRQNTFSTCQTERSRPRFENSYSLVLSPREYFLLLSPREYFLLLVSLQLRINSVVYQANPENKMQAADNHRGWKTAQTTRKRSPKYPYEIPLPAR